MEAFHYVETDKQDVPVMPGTVMPTPKNLPGVPTPQNKKNLPGVPKPKEADKSSDRKLYVLWLIIVIAIIALVYGGVCG